MYSVYIPTISKAHTEEIIVPRRLYCIPTGYILSYDFYLNSLLFKILLCCLLRTLLRTI